MLSGLLQRMGPAEAEAMVHVLPCHKYQRGILADRRTTNCGHVADASAGMQRGIHWMTSSHSGFLGAALREEAFFALHPEVRGRAMFRVLDAAHLVAARSKGPPVLPARQQHE